MTTWHDCEIPEREGRSMFEGDVELRTDTGKKLASIVWFSGDGPFYAHATMPDTLNLIMYRIGPCDSLEGAKRVCLDVVEGRKDVSDRASYG